MSKEKSKFRRFMSGATWGGIAGIFAGLMLAPKKGEETRADVKKSLDKVKEEAGKHSDKLDCVKEKINNTLPQIKSKFKEAVDKVKSAKTKKTPEKIETPRAEID